jgi:5'(3')-deoxyribonucleotidase
MSTKPIIAVDFAGVICDMKTRNEGKTMGVPMPGALDALQDLYDRYHVIIHTTMANTPRGRQVVADWLEHFDVDYHEIVGKPAADWYIDDNAIRHKTWKKTKVMLGIE